MRHFNLLTVDDRYSTPTLRFLSVVSVVRARELAERILGESPHHLGIEVWEGEMLVLRLERQDVLEQGEAASSSRDPGPSAPAGRRPLFGT